MIFIPFDSLKLKLKCNLNHFSITIQDYKCDLCKVPTTFNSTSELKNHWKECHGHTAHPSYTYADDIAKQPIIYNNTGQKMCKSHRTASLQTITEQRKIVKTQSTIEPCRFVNTARGSYTIPYVEPPMKVLKISSIDARKLVLFSHLSFRISIFKTNFHANIQPSNVASAMKGCHSKLQINYKNT